MTVIIAKPSQNTVGAKAGDSTDAPKNPFHLHFSGEFRQWLNQEQISLAITTYEGAKLIIIGPGIDGSTSISERNFERCMALAIDKNQNIWISTHHAVWQLENGLGPSQTLNGWDRAYLPRTSHITGAVDLHDLAFDKQGRMLGVITLYNCLAWIGHGGGSFSPFWRPPFISAMIAEDRCHLNGVCLENGEPAYVTMAGKSDYNDGWRDMRQDGGLIMDVRSDMILAENLSMPHTPRLHQGKLWFLEAGSGWLCSLEPKSKVINREIWRPGFLRGLRFHGDYALVCSSLPRDEAFTGLPLDTELKKKSREPRCALDIIDIKNKNLLHSVEITGSVRELYDVAIIQNSRQPLLYGHTGSDMQKIVSLGLDESALGPLAQRKKTS